MLEVIALLLGATCGFALAKLFGQQLMLVLYHSPFRFWRPYIVLYERLDSQYSYELLGGDKLFEDHKAFINLHEKQKRQANERFKRLWGTHAFKLAKVYGLVLLVALALFWSASWIFIVSFIVVQLISLSYDRYVKKQDLDLYVTLMLKFILMESENEGSAS